VRLDFLHVLFKILYALVVSIFTWTSSIRAIALKASLIIFLYSDLLIALLENESLNLHQAYFSMLAMIALEFKFSRAVGANKLDHFELLNDVVG
jgi:hypothetical protein